MMILAFAKTTASMYARRKSVTRREWTREYFAKVKRRFDEACEAKAALSLLSPKVDAGKPGLLCQAWDRNPRFQGKRLGTILITSLTWEPTRDIPDSDWEAEGFAFMAEQGLNVGTNLSCERLWKQWREDPELETAVIRFEIIELYPPPTKAQESLFK